MVAGFFRAFRYSPLEGFKRGDWTVRGLVRGRDGGQIVIGFRKERLETMKERHIDLEVLD